MGGTGRRNSAHWADARRRRSGWRRGASGARRPRVERNCTRTSPAAPLFNTGLQTVSTAIVPPVCAARGTLGYGMADSSDSARMPPGQATNPNARVFFRQGPKPHVSNAAGVGGHARVRLNDAMRVDAPPSVARSEHSRRAAGTSAGACGTVALGGIGATPGGDADDVLSKDEEEAPGTSTALRVRRGRTATRRLTMMEDGGAGSGSASRAGVPGGHGPLGGGTSGGGGARAAAATTRTGAAGGPVEDTRASAIDGDHGGLIPRAAGGAPDSRPHAYRGVPARPAPSASVPSGLRVTSGVPPPSAPVINPAPQMISGSGGGDGGGGDGPVDGPVEKKLGRDVAVARLGATGGDAAIKAGGHVDAAQQRAAFSVRSATIEVAAAAAAWEAAGDVEPVGHLRDASTLLAKPFAANPLHARGTKSYASAALGDAASASTAVLRAVDAVTVPPHGPPAVVRERRRRRRCHRRCDSRRQCSGGRLSAPVRARPSRHKQRLVRGQGLHPHGNPQRRGPLRQRRGCLRRGRAGKRRRRHTWPSAPTWRLRDNGAQFEHVFSRRSRPGGVRGARGRRRGGKACQGRKWAYQVRCLPRAGPEARERSVPAACGRPRLVGPQ